MKLAVILNGQWRTGIECSPYIKELFSKYDVDYFINTWSEDWYKSIKNESDVLCAESQHTILSDKKITLMKEIYNVSDERYEINSSDEIIPINRLENGYESGLLGWYSAWKANNKKIEFEKKNNFVYDVVIRFRPDMIIPKQSIPNFHLKIENVFKNNNEIYTQYIVLNDTLLKDNTPGHICTDYYIIASSMNMNLIHNWIDYKFENMYLTNKEHYRNLINNYNIKLNPVNLNSKAFIIRELFKNRKVLKYIHDNWGYREVITNSYDMLYGKVSSKLIEHYSDLVASNEDIELIGESYYLTESGLNNLKNKIFNKFLIDSFKHK
jgi:hypothetical protein